MIIAERNSCILTKNKDVWKRMSSGQVKKMNPETLKEVKFFLPHLELKLDALWHPDLELLSPCGVGLQLKDIEYYRVELSSLKYKRQLIVEGRLFMNNKKRIGDNTEHYGTPLFIGLSREQRLSTIAR